MGLNTLCAGLATVATAVSWLIFSRTLQPPPSLPETAFIWIVWFGLARLVALAWRAVSKRLPSV